MRMEKSILDILGMSLFQTTLLLSLPGQGEFLFPCKLFQLFSCYISAILYSSVLAFMYLNISLLHQRQCLYLPRFQA